MKRNALNQLVKHAREAAPTAPNEPVAAPYGFATRVVALARKQAEAASWMAWIERRAWRALAVAGGIAVLSVAVNLPAVADSIEQEVLEAEDPVTALWDLS